MPILNIYKRCNIQWLLFKALNHFSCDNYYVRCIIMTFGSIKNVYIFATKYVVFNVEVFTSYTADVHWTLG